jgi:phosphatidylserine synthase
MLVKSKFTFLILFSLIALSVINFLWLSINILAFAYLLSIPFSVLAWKRVPSKSN